MLKIEEINDGAEILAYIGHVDNVINGIIPEALKNRRFLANDYQYGFELGSPQSIYNLGESIFLNGMLYASRTDVSRTERNALMWGPEFTTTGIFIIPDSASENLHLKYFSFSDAMTLAQIYAEIYRKIECPFAVVGCIELEKIHAKAITRPPINHENVFDHAREYFQEEDYIDDNVNIAVTGVVSDHNDESLEAINNKLSSVLYYNPFAKKEALLSHTHALLLNRAIVDIDEVHPRHAVEVFHLMDESVVRYANLQIYRIADLEEIT
jgi:hypothetical protein